MSAAFIRRSLGRALTSTLSRSVPSASASASVHSPRVCLSTKSDKHPNIVSKSSVVGTHLSHNLDFSQASIGQVLDVPYVSTISDSEQGMWSSTFQIHDRLYTSTPFAQSVQLNSHVVPFYMILFKAVSMGHVDESKEVLDIDFSHATYIRPAYIGDTLRQSFTIKHLKNTSNNENCLLTVGCELFNQRNQLVFSVDKTMLYKGVKAPTFRMSAAPKEKPEKPRSHLISHILYNSDNLPQNNVLAHLHEGQLLLHAVSRPIGKSTNMSLSTLFRWTHPSIYNLKRYKDEEILVPGGLILAGSISASSRGLFETLGETLESCFFLNKVSPVDLIGAITYVHSIKQLKEGIEQVKITTLGLKNIDVSRELEGVPIPKELFTQQLHRKQIEKLVEEHAPILSGKIVVKADRTIIRQSPYANSTSIPLL